MTKTMREIDAMIAEHVMGWTCVGPVHYYHDECGPRVDTLAYWKEMPKTAAQHRADGLIDVAGLPPENAERSAERVACAEDDPIVVNGADLYSLEIVPRFASSIAAAWQVVERMRATHRISIGITDRSVTVDLDAYADLDRPSMEMDAETVALSICVAALRAHGIDVTPA